MPYGFVQLAHGKHMRDVRSWKLLSKHHNPLLTMHKWLIQPGTRKRMHQLRRR